MGELLKLTDIVTLTGASERYIREERKRGNLKGMKVGKHLLFEKNEVYKWMKRKSG